jgi:hypothetical protein
MPTDNPPEKKNDKTVRVTTITADAYPKPAEKFQTRLQAGLAEKKDDYPKPDPKFQRSLKETDEKSEHGK